MWEATLRGLKAALVEAGDFASGTSSRSTKLLHGGVRYLELAFKRLDRRQLRLVVDALQERKVVMDLAPHLARPLTLVTPLFRPLEIPYYWTGLKLYDLLAGKRRLAPSRYLPPEEVARLFPDLPKTLGGVAYQDGQFADFRLNLALILSALERGAVALNHAEAKALLLEGGRVRGAVVRDGLSGKEVEVRAKAVVNATGPLADRVRRLLDPHLPPSSPPPAGSTWSWTTPWRRASSSPRPGTAASSSSSPTGAWPSSAPRTSPPSPPPAPFPGRRRWPTSWRR